MSGCGTLVAMQASGASMSNLTLWSNTGMIGLPAVVHGHGHGGKVLRWTRRDVFRAYVLQRVPGRVFDQGSLMEELDRHASGFIYGAASKELDEAWIGVSTHPRRSLARFMDWPRMPADAVVVDIPYREVADALAVHGVT